MFTKHTFRADRFTIEALFIETLVKIAFIDCWTVLVMFVRHAFVAEKFTTDALFIDTFVKDAFVDN